MFTSSGYDVLEKQMVVQRMSGADPFKVDKTKLSVGNIHDASDEKEFWLSKTPDERLEALELIRQLVYGYDPATARLQRVFEVAFREQG